MVNLYSRSRAQKEKEEKAKEEEIPTPKEEVVEEEFTLPADNMLLKYVEEIRERIQPLPTSRDQVVALAQ